MAGSLVGKKLSDFPEVAKRFDASKNPLLVTAYAAGSNKKVFWLCENGHSYQRVVCRATSNNEKDRCPYCACVKVSPDYNLATKHILAHEYHPTKNCKRPEEVMPGSKEEVWWQCSLDKTHEWLESPEYRTHSRICPLCKKENNLLAKNPAVAAMFHPTKNDRGPEEYAPKSNKEVWWLCPESPEHVWKAPVCSVNRDTWEGSGCPYCAGQKVCSTNSLATHYPDIAKEFNSEKNGCTPNEIAKKSNRKVWWICSFDPRHEWQTSVSHRARGHGCLYCAGRKVSPDYNLEVIFPELAREFDSNLNQESAASYTPFSNYSVFWNCKRGHIWEAQINSRSSHGVGCPECSGFRRYSRAQIVWLEQIAREEDIVIKHGEAYGEHYIRDVGFVDGFCEETNTVYEFHGDFWHGHPGRYNPDHINSVNKETYRDLYEYTVARDKLILSLGYNLVVKWETEIPKYVESLLTGCPIGVIPTYPPETFSVLKKRSTPRKGIYLKDVPKLAAEWHPDFNTVPIDEVALNSGTEYWWKCSKDPCGCHVWTSTAGNRSNGGNGCPFCSHHAHCKHYNFATQRPYLLRFWDPSNTVRPEDCAPKGGKEILWRCDVDHRHTWRRKLGSVADDMKCAYCAGWKVYTESIRARKVVLSGKQYSP